MLHSKVQPATGRGLPAGLQLYSTASYIWGICRASNWFLQDNVGGARQAGASPFPRYFWMQVSTVSLVHSSSPVKIGSSTFLPSIRSIIAVGAL